MQGRIYSQQVRVAERERTITCRVCRQCKLAIAKGSVLTRFMLGTIVPDVIQIFVPKRQTDFPNYRIYDICAEVVTAMPS